MNTARKDEDRALGGPSSGPTALRIVLGGHLRRLREARGISREAAGDAIRATHSKISRLELGRTGFKQRDVADLLTLYQVVDEREREALLSLARQANVPGWWQRYSDILPNWFEVYVGLEEAASILRAYEVQFVHPLMQTAGYARALIQQRHADAPAAEIEQRVALRMRRQQRLVQDDQPLKLWMVLDESALRRPLGGREVMRAQLEHLLELSALRDVTFQVVPFSAGGHGASGGSFTILRFAHPDLPDVVYTEQLNSSLYFDKRDQVEEYVTTMDRLCVNAAVSPKETIDVLHAALKDI